MLVLGCLLLGLVMGELAAGESPVLALLAPAVLVPVLVWWRPELGLYALFAGTVAIEQFGYRAGPHEGAATTAVPFFRGVLPGGVTPAEVLLLLVLSVVVLQSVEVRRRILRPTPVALLLVAVLALAAWSVALGLFRGGQLHWALWEARPLIYIAAGYILGSALLTGRRAVQPLLWILVVLGAAKAVQGLVIFLDIRTLEPRPEAVLAHEEAFFFGAYLLLVAALWIFQQPGRLRQVATLGAPLVLLCDMVNSRRTAWLILGVGLLVLMLIAMVVLPQRRPAIAALIGVAAIGTAIYLPLFWNSTSSLAQPARAVRSEIAPDERDLASNQYREIEDYNLKVGISQYRGLGAGYGVPIQYFGIVDLTADNPLLRYVPHNGVLYHWFRFGIVGVVVVTCLWTQAAMSAVRLARAPDRTVAMLGAWSAAVLAGFVAMGLTDMGFFWFRNTLAIGILLGMVDALARTAAAARADGAGSAEARADLVDTPRTHESITR
jgi:hypothetical protein